MSDTFGARLRRRREEQGLALSVIAEDLKIKVSLLEAVERDDVSHWPSGIYRRAFIRAYAHAIGLNPDVVVREFVEIHPDPDDLIAAAFADGTASAGENATANGGPPTRLRNIVGSAIGSLSRLGRGGVNQRPVITARVPINAPDPVESAAPVFGEPHDVQREIEEAAGPAPVAVPAVQPEAGITFEQAAAETMDEASAEPMLHAAQPTPHVEPAAPAEPMAASPPRVPDPDFVAVAHVCTRFACVRDAGELQPVLQDAARILDASGLIVWLWDDTLGALRPALVHGYSDKVLAQLPTVGRDADNPTAAAFRSGQPCAIRGSVHGGGALVLPLVEWDGCAGVLAMEFQQGREQTAAVHAVATIFAAALSQLVSAARPVAEVPPTPDMVDEPVGTFTRPLRVRR